MPILVPLAATGPTKRHLIEQAYRECGVSDPDSDDIAQGLRKLDAMMRQFPFNATGYDADRSLPEDASGILDDYEDAVVGQLALRIAPGMGKSLSAEQRAALAQSLAYLKASVATLPTRYLSADTVSGAGNRRRSRTAFYNEAPDFTP